METVHKGGRFENISRRDWLAGLAMQGMLSNDRIMNWKDIHNFISKEKKLPSLSDAAYNLADAMIEESNK